MELHSTVLRKAEFINKELGYLDEEISKQYVEGRTLILPAAYGKMWEERDRLSEHCQSKRK